VSAVSKASEPIKLSFEMETVRVPIAKILPTKIIPEGIAHGSTAKTIDASVPIVGVVELPVVHRQSDGTYLMLDGHKRLASLKRIGAEDLECLVSFDDEAYSFNQWVSRLSPVQANRMIIRALDAGVPEERLAPALGRPVATIRNSRTLLKDISGDAIDLLKDKPVAHHVFGILKQVDDLRQLEMAELMVRMNNYSSTYAAGLLSRTKPDQRVAVEKSGGPRKAPRVKPDELVRIELELQALERDILVIDDTYGKDVVNLTIAQAYVKKLLDNARVVKYLAAKHGDLLNEFQKVQASASLDA
jgi:hypothetical protein